MAETDDSQCRTVVLTCPDFVLFLSCPDLFCPVLSCPVLSCPVLSSLVRSCASPHSALSCPVNRRWAGLTPHRSLAVVTPFSLACCSEVCVLCSILSHVKVINIDATQRSTTLPSSPAPPPIHRPATTHRRVLHSYCARSLSPVSTRGNPAAIAPNGFAYHRLTVVQWHIDCCS